MTVDTKDVAFQIGFYCLGPDGNKIPTRHPHQKAIFEKFGAALILQNSLTFYDNNRHIDGFILYHGDRIINNHSYCPIIVPLKIDKEGIHVYKGFIVYGYYDMFKIDKLVAIQDVNGNIIKTF